MATAMKNDSNYNVTNTRDCDPPGGCITHAQTDITRNAWYRLMPNGNTGAKVAGNRRQLNLGELRDDVKATDFSGWFLRILNESHNIPVMIVSHCNDDGLCTFTEDPERYDALPDGSIEWVLYPDVLFPFSITKDQGFNQAIQIGSTQYDRLSILSTEIRPVYNLSHESLSNTVALRTSRVDRLFYRTTAALTSAMQLCWGEFETHIG